MSAARMSRRNTLIAIAIAIVLVILAINYGLFLDEQIAPV